MEIDKYNTSRKRTCREYYLRNRVMINKKSKRKRDTNIEAARVKGKEYYEKNKHIILARNKKYKDKMNPNRREYAKKKRLTDPLYRMRTNLRSSLYKSFVRIGSSKPTNSNNLLGGDYGIVKSHIESQFTEGMMWGNYGKWDIDHKIPLISAKTSEELIRLCHYTNLQPLWEYDNILKAGKIISA